MKNEYKESTPEELAMRESVTYYMQLTDYAMEENNLLGRHDELCRLQVKIAGEYPESIALNLDNVMKFPRVKVLDPEAPNYGKMAALGFEVFVSMRKCGFDYEASTGLKGDEVFFLSLALWYEVCCLRDKLKLKGITYHNFKKEVNTALRRRAAGHTQGNEGGGMAQQEQPPHRRVRRRGDRRGMAGGIAGPEGRQRAEEKKDRLGG